MLTYAVVAAGSVVRRKQSSVVRLPSAISVRRLTTATANARRRSGQSTNASVSSLAKAAMSDEQQMSSENGQVDDKDMQIAKKRDDDLRR